MFLVTHPNGTEQECDSLEGAFAAGGMDKEAARQYLANLCQHTFAQFEKRGTIVTACTSAERSSLNRQQSFHRSRLGQPRRLFLCPNAGWNRAHGRKAIDRADALEG